MDGRNVADFVDPDIDAKLAELEKEEELLLANSLDALVDEEERAWADTKEMLAQLTKKREQKKLESRIEKSRNSVKVPRRRTRQLEEVQDELEALGKPSAAIRGRSTTRQRKREASPSEAPEEKGRSKSRAARSMSRAGDVTGLPDDETREKLERLRRNKSRRISHEHKKGEGDRKIPDRKPKHLFSGKRKGQKTAHHR